MAPTPGSMAMAYTTTDTPRSPTNHGPSGAGNHNGETPPHPVPVDHDDEYSVTSTRSPGGESISMAHGPGECGSCTYTTGAAPAGRVGSATGAAAAVVVAVVVVVVGAAGTGPSVGTVGTVPGTEADGELVTGTDGANVVNGTAAGGAAPGGTVDEDADEVCATWWRSTDGG